MTFRGNLERVKNVFKVGTVVVFGMVVARGSVAEVKAIDIDKNNPVPASVVGTVDNSTKDSSRVYYACDGGGYNKMACPTGQYCFITNTRGVPSGVCLYPGEVQP